MSFDISTKYQLNCKITAVEILVIIVVVALVVVLIAVTTAAVSVALVVPIVVRPKAMDGLLSNAFVTLGCCIF